MHQYVREVLLKERRELARRRESYANSSKGHAELGDEDSSRRFAKAAQEMDPLIKAISEAIWPIPGELSEREALGYDWPGIRDSWLPQENAS